MALRSPRLSAAQLAMDLALELMLRALLPMIVGWGRGWELDLLGERERQRETRRAVSVGHVPIQALGCDWIGGGLGLWDRPVPFERVPCTFIALMIALASCLPIPIRFTSFHLETNRNSCQLTVNQ